MIRKLRMPAETEPPSAELMQKLCGILDVNAFELRSPGVLDGLLPLRGLYIEATLMAHDCRGNTYLTVDDNFQLTVYASVPIKQDEPILFNYTSSLLVSEWQKFENYLKFSPNIAPILSDGSIKRFFFISNISFSLFLKESSLMMMC